MKDLITGHTGLVGGALKSYLESKGHDVYGISKSSGFDLLSKRDTDVAFEIVQPDVVIMCAANAAESRGQVSPIDMTKNNVNIFLNVLEASINHKVKKFVYISSVSVYGEATVPYKENGPTIPKDIYGVNKLACEQMLKIMAKVYGFEYTIFRPHNIYGPGQKMDDPYRNVVALFMRNIIEDKPYKLFGNGEMRRAFSYVDDVVEVIAESLNGKFVNTTVNVGSDNDISIRELSDLIQQIAGKKAKITSEPPRPQEISMFLADHSLQNSLVDYKNTPIMEGLRKTWNWVLTQKLGEIIKKEDEIAV